MTREQKTQLIQLQRQGFSSHEMADFTGLNANTIRSFFSRQGTVTIESTSRDNVCAFCHAAITNRTLKRDRRFCSDLCRSRWWNAHRAELKTYDQERICCYCRRSFQTYGPAKYCSRECFFLSRRKQGGQHG